jgi:endoribonuclease Dicer
MTSALARGKWIPSPLMTSRPTEDDNNVKRKVLADVVESILGLIYLEFGYKVSEQVASELHVVLPLPECSEAKVEFNQSGNDNGKNKKLLEVVRSCTGHNVFTRPTIVEEAFTHPSAIDTDVPSYQRLEWMGDAVLCLCVREWLYRTFGSSLSLGDLVLIEGAIVSNETLGFLSIKYGLQQHINHCDQSLPSRILSYCLSLEDGCGLWGAGMLR